MRAYPVVRHEELSASETIDYTSRAQTMNNGAVNDTWSYHFDLVDAARIYARMFVCFLSD